MEFFRPTAWPDALAIKAAHPGVLPIRQDDIVGLEATPGRGGGAEGDAVGADVPHR